MVEIIKKEIDRENMEERRVNGGNLGLNYLEQ